MGATTIIKWGRHFTPLLPTSVFALWDDHLPQKSSKGRKRFKCLDYKSITTFDLEATKKYTISLSTFRSIYSIFITYYVRMISSHL